MAMNKKQLIQELEKLQKDYDNDKLDGSVDDYDQGYNSALDRICIELQELLDEAKA